MERILNLPEWKFQDGELVTVNKIRTETLGDDWIGDESSGIPHTKLESKIIKTPSIEEQLETF